MCPPESEGVACTCSSHGLSRTARLLRAKYCFSGAKHRLRKARPLLAPRRVEA